MGLFSTPKPTVGKRVVLYGAPGVGKTTLAAQAPAPVVFLDFEKSIGGIYRAMGLEKVGVLTAGDTLVEIISALRKTDEWEAVQTIVVDSLTGLELRLNDYICATKPLTSTTRATSIDDYPFGGGASHQVQVLTSVFLPLLQKMVDLGKNVILLAHECVSDIPVAGGKTEATRWEPAFCQAQKKKMNARGALVAWADAVSHYIFAHQSKTREVNCTESPTSMAKNREGIKEPLLNGVGLWEKLGLNTKQQKEGV